MMASVLKASLILLLFNKLKRKILYPTINAIMALPDKVKRIAVEKSRFFGVKIFLLFIKFITKGIAKYLDHIAGSVKKAAHLLLILLI